MKILNQMLWRVRAAKLASCPAGNEYVESPVPW